jgi:chromosome segregation ATPase
VLPELRRLKTQKITNEKELAEQLEVGKALQDSLDTMGKALQDSLDKSEEEKSKLKIQLADNERRAGIAKEHLLAVNEGLKTKLVAQEAETTRANQTIDELMIALERVREVRDEYAKYGKVYENKRNELRVEDERIKQMSTDKIRYLDERFVALLGTLVTMAPPGTVYLKRGGSTDTELSEYDLGYPDVVTK